MADSDTPEVEKKVVVEKVASTGTMRNNAPAIIIIVVLALALLIYILMQMR